MQALINAARGFGLPDSRSKVVPWLFIKAGRDFGIALAMFGLVAIRERKAAGVFVFACMVMPIVDALSVMHGSASLAFALAVHGSAAFYGAVLAAALLRHPPLHLVESQVRPPPEFHAGRRWESARCRP
ncbi:DUF4267 domain-containing protein [Corallococcus coralloides]|uniref:DUF4267 domain-containing protein n=1 Tax=Corallococcus coralloides TaxID=184914 RepID=UPI00384B37E4